MEESKAIVTKIQASSRASVKVGEAFYTVEYSEERSLPDGLLMTEEDLTRERSLLWDTVNSECDNQIADILKTFKK